MDAATVSTLTLALLAIVAVALVVLVIEIYKLNRAVGPIANSPIVRGLSSIGT